MKTRVIIESPFRFKERISVKPGNPVIPSSIGIVINRSTSSGERPGASAATCTCTLVTSGKASTDSRLVANKPAMSKTQAIITTNNRCWRDRRTILSIIRVIGYSVDVYVRYSNDRLRQAQFLGLELTPQ